jgi:hypothetical protein
VGGGAAAGALAEKDRRAALAPSAPNGLNCLLQRAIAGASAPAQWIAARHWTGLDSPSNRLFNRRHGGRVIIVHAGELFAGDSGSTRRSVRVGWARCGERPSSARTGMSRCRSSCRTPRTTPTSGDVLAGGAQAPGSRTPPSFPSSTSASMRVVSSGSCRSSSTDRTLAACSGEPTRALPPCEPSGIASPGTSLCRGLAMCASRSSGSPMSCARADAFDLDRLEGQSGNPCAGRVSRGSRPRSKSDLFAVGGLLFALLSGQPIHNWIGSDLDRT